MSRPRREHVSWPQREFCFLRATCLAVLTPASGWTCRLDILDQSSGSEHEVVCVLSSLSEYRYSRLECDPVWV
eukprot:8904220-Pyramimonas_sp.AAC.1